MSDVATMPTRAQFKPLRETKTLAEAFAHPEMIERFRQAVPRHLPPERMLRVCVQAVQKTPRLAECNMWSLLGAMLALAALGLEPNTPLGLAYLIPFEKTKWNPEKRKRESLGYDVQVIIGYRGYIDLARRTGSLVSIHADVVFEGDEFSFEYGSHAHLRHVPKGDHTERRPLWVYMHARLTDGEAFEVRPIEDVMRIRDASQGYRAAKTAAENAEKQGWKMPASYTDAPWVKHWIEMAKKTLVRAGAKMLPMSIELANAAALDAISETGGLDMRHLATEGVTNFLEAGAQSFGGDPFFGNDLGTGTHDEAEQVVRSDQQMSQERPAKTQTQTKPAKQDPPPAAAAAAADQPVTKPAFLTPSNQAPFEAYLSDAFGEPADGASHFTDPLAFAQALHEAWTRAPAGSRNAVIEHNADAMVDAAHVSPAASDIIDNMTTHQAQQEPQSLVLPVPSGPRGPDMAAYVVAARAAAAAISDTAGVDAWEAANLATFSKFPSAKKIEVAKVLAERRSVLNPAQQQAPAKSDDPAAQVDTKPAEPARDMDTEWTRSTAAEIVKAPNPDREGVITTLITGVIYLAKMGRFKSERPELHAQIIQALTDRQQPASADRREEAPPPSSSDVR